MKGKNGGVGIGRWFVGIAAVSVLGGSLGAIPYKLDSERGVVVDGDTLRMEDGRTVRILGINTKERGKKNFDEAGKYLGELVEGKELWLEPDRVIIDRFGRGLFWIWIDCESKPTVFGQSYMILTSRTHREGLRENPEGCKSGKLVSEEMIKSGYSKPYFLKKKGEMKYERRLLELGK